MDLASLLGLLLCFGMCAFGMIQSAGLAHIDRYLDLPSMIITFGGSFFAILMDTEGLYRRTEELYPDLQGS